MRVVWTHDNFFALCKLGCDDTTSTALRRHGSPMISRLRLSNKIPFVTHKLIHYSPFKIREGRARDALLCLRSSEFLDHFEALEVGV